jgi:hypothetical protein
MRRGDFLREKCGVPTRAQVASGLREEIRRDGERKKFRTRFWKTAILPILSQVLMASTNIGPLSQALADGDELVWQ